MRDIVVSDCTVRHFNSFLGLELRGQGQRSETSALGMYLACALGSSCLEVEEGRLSPTVSCSVKLRIAVESERVGFGKVPNGCSLASVSHLQIPTGSVYVCFGTDLHVYCTSFVGSGKLRRWVLMTLRHEYSLLLVRKTPCSVLL